MLANKVVTYESILVPQLHYEHVPHGQVLGLGSHAQAIFVPKPCKLIGLMSSGPLAVYWPLSTTSVAM